jgi:SSS family solute:Na+ symporter
MDGVSIGVTDIVVIGLYLVFITWWGLRHVRNSDAGSYFLAGRTMPWWAVGLALFAASISSTTLIGQSGDAYHTGIAVFNYNLTGGVVVMVLFAIFLLPLYIRSGIFTIPEFLEKRFDRRSRYYFSAISIIGSIFLDAAGALYAAALIIKMILPGVDLGVVVCVFALITASYTIPGGLSSAISAELIQAVILIGGSIILCLICFASGGGEYLSGLMQDGDMAMKLIRPLTDPATPWLGLFIGMPISGIYFWANNQTLVQRVLSAKNVDEGRKGVMFCGFLTLMTLVMIIFPGVIARSLFPGVDNPDMVYPTMIVNLLPSGLLGVLLSVMLAALMSTMSAVLNSVSTLITMDFYAQLNPSVDSGKLVRVGKITALVILVIAAVWAPNISRFDSLLKYYQEMISYIAPPVVAAFLTGIFSRRVNAAGAFFGLISGLVLAVVMLFFRENIFRDMHFLFVIPILFAFSVLVIILVSLLYPSPDEENLQDTVFSFAEFRKEGDALRGVPFWRNYRIWGLALIAISVMLLVLFS